MIANEAVEILPYYVADPGICIWEVQAVIINRVNTY